ncbi:MAG: integrin alpha [Desulfobacterales bacterium]
MVFGQTSFPEVTTPEHFIRQCGHIASGGDTRSDTYLGYSVPQSVNGDGTADISMGAPWARKLTSYNGSVYTIFGGHPRQKAPMIWQQNMILLSKHLILPIRMQQDGWAQVFLISDFNNSGSMDYILGAAQGQPVLAGVGIFGRLHKKLFRFLQLSAASSVTQTTANSGGNISSDGGATVTAKGVCWSTAQNPTISDNKTSDGTRRISFTSSITGLSPNTTYYVHVLMLQTAQAWLTGIRFHSQHWHIPASPSASAAAGFGNVNVGSSNNCHSPSATAEIPH